MQPRRRERPEPEVPHASWPGASIPAVQVSAAAVETRGTDMDPRAPRTLEGSVVDRIHDTVSLWLAHRCSDFTPRMPALDERTELLECLAPAVAVEQQPLFGRELTL